MPTQQPSLSHKKWFQTLVILNVLTIFSLSFLGVFTGPNAYYYMGISGCISISIVLYSIVKGLSDWRLVFIYGLIAISLIANVLLNLRHN